MSQEGSAPRSIPRSVWAAAAIVVLALLVVASRYGFHRDELYFVAAGRRLAWGFVDQPPLTPFIARLADLAPGAVGPTVLRIVPAFSAGATVLLTAVMARRFGAGDRATTLAGVFAAVGGFFLAVGHLLATATFEVLIVACIIVIVISLIDGADPRWWILVGALLGIGMLNKNTIAALAVGLLLALLATAQRSILRTKWLWLGGLVTFTIAAPNRVWQAANGWPQVEMAKSLAGKSDGPVDYLLLQIAILSVFLVVPAIAGGRWLWQDPRGSTWRAFPIAFVGLFVLFLVSMGKGYYIAALYLPLLAAGAIAIDTARRSTRTIIVSLVAVGAVVGIPLALPVVPPERVQPFNDVNKELGETYGWNQLVDQIEDVFVDLPPAERSQAAIFTANYGQAGAIEILAADRLPQPVSGHNSYADWGPGPPHGVIIGVGYVPAAMRTICPTITVEAVITNEAGLPNDEYGTQVWLCREPTGQLESVWDDLRHFD